MISAAAWLAAGWVADARVWGVHALAFLPRAAWIAAAVAFAVCVHPRVARTAGRWVVRAAAFGIESRARIAIVALAAGVLFWFLRLRFQFLGDGIVWLEKIQTRGAFHHFEPLSTFIVRTVAQSIPAWKPATQLASIASGMVWWVATAAICRRAFAGDTAVRGLVWFVLVVHPMVLLFCGYIESYPLLVAAQALLVAAWSIGGGRAAWWSAGVAGVAIALHVQALAWLPALAVAVAVTAGAAHPRRRARAIAATGATAAALALALALMAAVGDTPNRLAQALGGESGLGGWSPARLASWTRVLDVANQAALAFGAALVLLAAAVASRTGTGWLREHFWAATATLALGALSIWAVAPRIGAARDWDLYLAAVLPVTLLAGAAWQRTRATWRAADSEALTGRIAVLALVTTMAWVASQVDDTRAARRMVVLQSERGSFSNFARGYANEALGMYYRTRNPQAARDAYARAVVNNPLNARYWNNLGMHELLRRDQPAAHAAWQRALALGMHEWYVYYNLGMVALEMQNAAEADSLGEVMVRRWPERWNSWLCRGQARLVRGRAAEAVGDLERAFALQPQQPEIAYVLGLALLEAGRAADARAAFQATLRARPDHADARRELQRLDAQSPAPSAPPR